MDIDDSEEYIDDRFYNEGGDGGGNNSSSSSSNDTIESVTAGMNIKKFQFSNGCAYIQDGFYIPKYLITMAGTVRTNRIPQYNDWINDKHGSKEKYHRAI